MKYKGMEGDAQVVVAGTGKGGKRHYFGPGGRWRGALTGEGARVPATATEIAEAKKLLPKSPSSGTTRTRSKKPSAKKPSAKEPPKASAPRKAKGTPFELDGQPIGLAGIQRRHPLSAAELAALRALQPGQAIELTSGGGVWGTVRRRGTARPGAAGPARAQAPRASLSLRATRRYAKLALARGDHRKAARYLDELAALTRRQVEGLLAELYVEIDAAKARGAARAPIASDADARAFERTRER